MIKYKIKNVSSNTGATDNQEENTITINNITIKLSKTVKQVYEYDDKLILLLNFNPKEMDNESNVIAFNDEGIQLWELEELSECKNKYIEIFTEKEELILYDIDYFKYVIDSKTGKIKKAKIRPLTDINNDSEYLLTKTNVIQLMFFILILLIFIFSIKASIKSSIKNNSSNNNKEIVYSQEEETIKENSKIVNKEAKTEISNNINKTKDDIETIEEPSNSTISIINKAIEVADNCISSISSGKAKTIKSTNSERLVCTYISTIDGERIKVLYNNKEITVKLISIKQNDTTMSYISNILSSHNTLYIEQDNKKTNSSNEYLGYVWLSDDSEMSNMLNYYLLHNKYATFNIQSPNIKYNYYINK